jgi:hypothetical protein
MNLEGPFVQVAGGKTLQFTNVALFADSLNCRNLAMNLAELSAGCVTSEAKLAGVLDAEKRKLFRQKDDVIAATNAKDAGVKGLSSLLKI